MLLTIAEVYQKAQELSRLEEVKVQGWTKSSIRQDKFVEINDGSCLKNLQLVCPPDLAEELKKANFNSSLIANGRLVLTPKRAQSCELQIQQIEFINPTGENYPLQRKNIPLETIRNYPHLRAKTNYFLVIFRLRQTVSKAIHDFFNQRGFYWVHTPLITANDTEGAGELFTVTTRQDKQYEKDFFCKQTRLTVSGQLQAEALVQGLGKVYTFGPCFRAENSHTTRHLAEFWMVEAEIAFADLEETTNVVEGLIKHVINCVLDNNNDELEYLENHEENKESKKKETKKEIISKLKKIAGEEFKKIDYNEAIKILKKNKENFIFDNIQWGINLQSEHEKYLFQYFNRPVFVLNYPQEIKAFYMKNNLDCKTVACFDLLFPQIGEIAGGSAREDNYRILKEKAQKIGLDINNLSWYFDLRKSGYAPGAGFGLGLERLIMYISGTENIRDVIPFPRYPQHLEG
jgi:asparaginyl-tRNA synthetase